MHAAALAEAMEDTWVNFLGVHQIHHETWSISLLVWNFSFALEFIWNFLDF